MAIQANMHKINHRRRMSPKGIEMNRDWLAVWFATVLVVSSFGAQAGTPWRSAYYPSDWTPESIENKTFESDAFIQDYSLVGYRQGQTPPTRPNARVFDVTDYGADKTGQNDSTNAIQAAIDAAQAVNDSSNPGGIVYLPEGTYLLAPQGSNKQALRISQSHVVLRGAGVGKSFLINTRKDMRQKRVIQVKPTRWASPYADVSPSIDLASDVLTPTPIIPLESVNGLSVGQWIVIRNDVTWSWVNEHNEPEWQSSAGRRQLRGLFYIRKIEAIDSANSTIRINTPLRYYLKTRDNARVHGLSPYVLQEVGLEHFSIGMLEQTNGGFGESDWNASGTAGYNSHDTQMINIEQTRNVWVRDVHSFEPPANNRGVHFLSKGVLVRDSAYLTIMDVVMKNAQYGGGGGNGYGYTLANTQESLVLRAEAHFMRHGFSLSNPGASGNVFHACLDVDSGQAKGDGSGYRTSGRASDTHMHFTQSNLFDVCEAERSGFESRYRPYGSIDHAFTGTHGVFWNTEGNDSGFAIPALVWSQQARYGYVIGTRGSVNNVKITNGTDDARTAPLDIVEGEGMGNDLQPFSLWLDQRAKRFQVGDFERGFADGFEARP